MKSGTKTLVSAGAPFEDLHIVAAEKLLTVRHSSEVIDDTLATRGLLLAVHFVSATKRAEADTGDLEVLGPNTSLLTFYEAVTTARTNLVEAGIIPEELVPKTDSEIINERETCFANVRINNTIRVIPARFGYEENGSIVPYISAFEDQGVDNATIADAIKSLNIIRLAVT